MGQVTIKPEQEPEQRKEWEAELTNLKAQRLLVQERYFASSK